MQSGDLNKVWEIKALKRKPKQDEAMKILERIAKQVQPIMRKHNWRVKVLSEMYGKRKNLLGLNVGRGIEVKLRLRSPNNELEFYPFDMVLDTMLHELCHNAHGPHNASFYQLWDQLRKECEELMSKGISGAGEGFDLPGRRLGGLSRQPPLSSLRKTTVAAAENRKQLKSLLPSGPLRVGGDRNIMSTLSPVQAAAMAAERRLRDEIWCASASGGLDAEEEGDPDSLETLVLCQPGAASTSSKASNGDNVQSGAAASRKRPQSGSITNLIDLSNVENFTSSGARDKSRKTSGSCSSSSSSSMGVSASGSTPNHAAGNKLEEAVQWTCETCTLLNPPLAPVCEACETLKPKDASVQYKFWSCKICTLENSINLERCSACSEWRYSRGPPLTTLPPNLGT
ncbi:DNA-dependent metalloprotease WSS1 isoform X1 [Beta vulgaris subsp. vulgaris]|uniref:DNA-dependent metalloprotease WSS1 isoform X1 n=1 Tax=Beta vulgaris subsp. vulgaris TaxID=3555 RepID=UPI00203741A3|nr:DNA-dependent metalloprotease WSS1 isoform X1 [Beta vulgaris subsp. vulgaris]